MKNKLFKKYLTITFITVCALILFVVTPLFVAYPPYGKSFLLSITPMLFITLSWMTGAWWAWDKERFIFMAVTVGAIPLRMAVGLMWVWFCLGIPNINPMMFILSLMGNWIIFTVIELAMIQEFSRKLVFTPEIEKDEV